MLISGLSTIRRLAPTVQESARFSLRYASRRPGLARYHLRESGISIYVRHATPDINTLEEIFVLGHYRPPAPVEDRLARLGAGPKVVDLGANIGLFGAWILGRAPEARITAFEPEPSNVEVLERTIRANALEERWELHRVFAGVARREVPFSAGEFANARVVDASETALRVQEVDVFPYLGDADVLKIDIEGAEWAIFADPRFAEVSVSLIALEYHPYRAPGPDARRAAIDALGRSGYATADVDYEAAAGHGVLWAWTE